MPNTFLDVVVEDNFMDHYGRLIWVIVALLALVGLVWLFIRKRRQKKKEADKHNTPTNQP